MIYITYTNLNDIGYIGIKKKILNQVKVFEKYEQEVFYTQYEGQMLYLMKREGVIVEKRLTISEKELNKQLWEWIKKYNIKKAYIRYALSNKWFVEFLRRLQENGIKSILEFPTFPYDGELKEGRIKYEDRMYRKELSKYIGMSTTYSKREEILGIPCISLQNGVGGESFVLRKRENKTDEIILIAVASMAPWHGYERVIEGLRQYYIKGGKEKIHFLLVGNGTEISYYKRLVSEYQLENFVIFLGTLFGEDLEDIYSKADVAIGSLGIYKSGVFQAAPIKLREYCAKGIPFIYGYDDIGFSGEEKYTYKVSNDDTPIDIQKVIDFCLYMREHRELVEEMRTYALEKFSWDSLMIPVIKYYQS